jgi:hypothetical protein
MDDTHAKSPKTRAVEKIATALIEFMEANEQECQARLQETVGARFDRQDDTLRMIWRQSGGDPATKLPIDEPLP